MQGESKISFFLFEFFCVCVGMCEICSYRLMKGENYMALLFFRGRVVKLEGGKGGRVVRWQDGKGARVMRWKGGKGKGG